MLGNRLDKQKRGKAGLSEPERRASRRFNLNWSVIIKGADSRGENFDEACELQNLSSSGAFLYLTRPLSVGSQIDIWVKLPFQKENWMRYEGEVVRVEGGRKKVGIGLKFCWVWPDFLPGGPYNTSQRGPE